MSLMRTPCNPHRNATDTWFPTAGARGSSIGLPRLMSPRHRSENKQQAGGRWGRMRGRREREGLLAGEEYLLRDDGMGGGGTTSTTSGISVMDGFGSWMKRLLFQKTYTTSSRLAFPSLLRNFSSCVFFDGLKRRR